MLFSTFLSPLDIAFEFKGTGAIFYSIADWITFGFFVLDILVNLRTTYYNDNNEEIIDQKMIAYNYVKSIQFLFDVLSTLPISEISGAFSDNKSSAKVVKWFK